MTKNIITLVSTNTGKRKSLERALRGLDYEIKTLGLDIIEPQFDSIEEIATFKAQQAFSSLKSPLVVNDGGLVIPELNGFPGPYTKYITNTLTCDNILALMKDCKSRDCYLTQCLIYVDQDGNFHKFQDKVLGTIAEEISTASNPRSWGTLWQIFIPKFSEKPLAEISEEEYHTIIRPKAQTNSVWEDLRNYLLDQTITSA